MDLKLKLSGMGILIKHDARVIKRALEKVGYEVEIDDPEETPKWFHDNHEVGGQGKIVLTLDHEYWGG